MSKSTHLLFKKLGLLLALAFPACALPDDDGELQDEVSSTSQALGSSLTVGLARGASGLRDWGTDTVVFAGPQDGSGTTQLVTMFLSDGSTVTSSLGNTLKSAEADSEIFFIAGASLQKWGLLGNVFVAPVGVPKGRLGLSSSTVYWSDQNGIQKVSRTSNVVGPPVLAGANNRLIGVDGSVLYYVLENSNAHWLKKVNTNGTGETVLASAPASFLSFQDVSWDSTYLYWVTNDTSPRKVRRMLKVGGNATPQDMDTSSSTSVVFSSPVSNGSNLYWIKTTSGVSEIRRRTSAGAVSTARAGLTQAQSLNIRGSELFWAEKTGSNFVVSKAALP